MNVELSHEESQILLDALRSYLGDLRAEISKTDSHEFREGLKRQEEVLKTILARLTSGRA